MEKNESIVNLTNMPSLVTCKEQEQQEQEQEQEQEQHKTKQ